MNRKTTMPKYVVILTLVTLLLLSITANAQEAPQPTPDPIESGEMTTYQDVFGRAPDHVCELPFVESTAADHADHHHHQVRLTADEIARLPQTANIQVNYTGGWPTAARTAFDYAVSIWETTLTSSVTIVVDADWANLGSGILGAAGPADYAINFSGAPQANTWYPIALANSLAGTDLSGASDISVSLSSSFNWYYGTDGNTPGSQLDLVSVVLHELGHGLGFTGSFQANNSIAAWGASTPWPDKYDRFIENGSGTQLISGYPNNSGSLRAQLTSNNVYFDGTNTRNQNGGNRAEIYAPSSWSGGSSLAHVAEQYNGTENSLMTWSLSNGEAEHEIGPITLGMFADMGWQVNLADPTPVINNGAQLLEQNTSINNAIDLRAYASDDSDADNQLDFEITNGNTSTTISGNNISVTLDSNRYLDVTSTGVGTLEVDVEVTDTDNNSSSATFTFISVAEIFPVYLPAIQK